jgi:flagellar motility protein MotE (MotC chaperone)/sporulation protein YlmC with PRC-barrel domain
MVMQFRSVYFSRILGNKIFTAERKVLGTLSDIGVDITFKNPKASVAAVKTKEGIIYIDFNNLDISKENGQYVLRCKSADKKDIGDCMLLKKYVLDKQIIDVNGRKVVRANDVRLVILASGMFIAAVDIGMGGLLRRIGIAKPLKTLGVRTSTTLMLWDDIQTAFTSKDIKLAKSYNKLSTLHPSDLADIIEDFDTNTGTLIFSALDNATAADVLEEMEEEVQLNLLRTLSVDKAADILEEMPADEAADILDGLNESKAEELLSSMEKEASDEIRDLMEYDDNQVGSLMNTEFIACSADYSVSAAAELVRKCSEEYDQIYNIYVVDDSSRIKGSLSLRDLVTSDSGSGLKDIMDDQVTSIRDTDDIDHLIKVAVKYNLLSIPIVDGQECLIGIVNINDIVYELTRNDRRYR